MIAAFGFILIAAPVIGLLIWMACDVGINQVFLGLGFTALISTPIIIGAYLLEYAGVLS